MPSIMPLVNRFNIDSKLSTVSKFLLLFLILSSIVNILATSRYYSTSDNDLTSDLIDDYNGNIAKLLFVNRKRSCLRRGASCDHRPDDCCDSSVCRCNIWGTNCRCHRAGLFQRWG